MDRVSSRADLATLRLEAPAPFHAQLLELDDRSEASVTGEAVVLIGYPAGVEGILARAGTEVTQKIAGSTQNVSQVLLRMASQQLIRSTTTQGHIGDVLGIRSFTTPRQHSVVRVGRFLIERESDRSKLCPD